MRKIGALGAALAVTATIIGVAGPASAAAGTHGVRWDADGTTTELQGLPGGTVVLPRAINGGGTVVGYSELEDNGDFGYHAIRWGFDGAATDLGTLPGDTNSDAYDINDSGIAVGMSVLDFGDSHAVRWAADGTVTELTVPGAYRSYAYSINSSGVVAGEAYIGSQVLAVRWAVDGTPTILPGTSYNNVAQINDDGVIAGSSGSGGFRRAVVWTTDDQFVDRGTVGSGDMVTAGITENGAIYGTATAQGSQHRPTYAVRWSASGTQTQLPVLAGDQRSAANGMNAAGTTVGMSATSTGSGRAVRWNANGTATALPLISTYGSATGINDSGVIVGSSDGHAVRWSAAGVLTDLGVLPGDVTSKAIGVNANGSAFGTSTS